MSEEQICRQCGHCCERWGWGQSGSPADLRPWIEHGRKDILQHVTVYLDNGQKTSGTRITADDLPRITKVRYWQDPSGQPLRHCPFLGRSKDGKAFCGIHDLRPEVCRDYAPWNCGDGEYQNVRCLACRERTP
ncbi:MAG: Flagellin N-methylase [Methanoregulaceae archaeon PtaB.Bin009]|nr:MAG: Flagellin N-methylase [Methanoregulaceae archaeon PtaB.Bin009]OPY40728.1 MAG: Flagellin N-methylase [Methanoregulaceae archaeon PtaU1.Bin066]HNQ30428.1 YkgJ family cysteine cluster protein [Methanolinea sp.]